MPANIEIKARAHNFHQQQLLAEALSDTPVTLLEQEDIFFNCQSGRLKLRIFDKNNGELIHYYRDDQTDAKESKYNIVHVDNPLELKLVLSMALIIKGTVKKRRFLYITGQTRIHLDSVEQLGDFLELEYVLQDDEDRNQATMYVNEIMKKLTINNSDLIAEAYIDLLMNNKNTA